MDGCEGSGDADFDCLVNLNDYAFFARCKGGPGNPYPEGIACIYLDMDCDSDVDLADYSEFLRRFGTVPPVCSDPSTAPCCDDAYMTLNVSTSGTSGVTASIIPNPAWVNELELAPSGNVFFYANAPSVTLTLLSGDLSSFLHWEVDGVSQGPGQQAVTVTMDQTRNARAVFVSLVDPIPTLSEWGLATMALLVLTAGTLVVMRQRALRG